jgi:hypothetical protein
LERINKTSTTSLSICWSFCKHSSTISYAFMALYWITQVGGGYFLYLYLHKAICTMVCAYVFCVLECGLFNCTLLKPWPGFQQSTIPNLHYATAIVSLMFVPCNIRRSGNNQHYALICTTPLFYILFPTCFGSSLPSSGSFLDPSELLEIQIEWVVYHIMYGYAACVPDCRGSDFCASQLSPYRMYIE